MYLTFDDRLLLLMLSGLVTTRSPALSKISSSWCKKMSNSNFLFGVQLYRGDKVTDLADTSTHIPRKNGTRRRGFHHTRNLNAYTLMVLSQVKVDPHVVAKASDCSRRWLRRHHLFIKLTTTHAAIFTFYWALDRAVPLCDMDAVGRTVYRGLDVPVQMTHHDMTFVKI
ncbi:hypothetical protein B566_EDAN001512 [Ephemera danica]|nr:hypothetical protein B566_EDAN001512 [Ephemera danica]